MCVARQPEVALSWGPVRGVAGAFAVTAGELTDWQETREAARGIYLTSPWRRVGFELPLTVCYYDGTSKASLAARSVPFTTGSWSSSAPMAR
jgi:hypothetical protein